MTTYGDIKSGEVAAPAVVAKEISALPALVKAAAAKLASATTAAEVLDAKDAASLAYDASKRAARVAKAKKAHDELIAAAHRAQADALEIEAAAKRRLADEYDGGQERGEIATPGKPVNVLDENIKAKVSEVGLTRKQVHEARRVRNAESAQPGVVRAALDQAIAEGKEPTRAVVNEAVSAALGETKPVDTRTEAQRDADTIQSAWDHACEPGRAMFLAANNLEIQAKASEDNGGTSAKACAPMTGEVSRVSVGTETDVDDGRRVEASGGAAPVITNSCSAAPAVEAVARPQAPAQSATAKVSRSVTPPPPGGTDKAGEAVPPPTASPATQFNNPRCQSSKACRFAHSRDCCFDCSVAWAQRPKEEQIRLWAEANEAAA